MEFSVDFYKDEVRYGFYIPTVIKQAWAAELMVLAEIDRICRKHHIKYYADWGSMLGAIRHGGFIPWDDDMDIGMLRDDYIRFRQVAAKELPKEYAIHDFESKEDHWLFLSRVVNRNHICFDEDHLNKYHNFPYIAPVDIFVMDYLYREEEKEKERCDEIKIILAVADAIVERGLNATEMRMLKTIELKYHRSFSHIQSRRKLGIELYRLAQEQMARVPRDEADFVGQIFPWVLKGNRGMPKEDFDKMVRLPFENTTIPVPADYHTVIQRKYGNYMEIYKGQGLHDYPFFEGQRDNLLAVADDFELPEFRFSQEMLTRGNKEQEKSLKDIVKEYINALEEQMECLEEQVMKCKQIVDFDLLSECQKLAVDLGTLIEEVKGENNPNIKEIISCIEAYCEALFQIHELLISDSGILERQDFNICVKKSNNVFEAVKKMVHEKLLQKSVILFVTTGSREWNGFKKICERSIEDKNNEVYVVLVPVAFKDILGRTTFKDVRLPAELGFLPEGIQIRQWDTIDVRLLHPDRIYIQDPYDNENPCLTIPPQLYAKKLRYYTENLIYVPPYYVKEFGEADSCELYNMKHYVTAPAVMYADQVLVQSENMKKMYIEKLVAFAGEETRGDWDRKLKVADLYASREFMDGDSKETIVYCIGENKLAAKKDAVLKEVKEKLEEFEKSSSDIKLKICMYPPALDEWKGVDSCLTQRLLELIDGYTDQDWCEMCNMNKVEWEEVAREGTVYYGSPSPLVHLFTTINKETTIVE